MVEAGSAEGVAERAGSNDPESIAVRVRDGRVGWLLPLVMTFVRTPLIVLGVAATYAAFALRGYPDALPLSLVSTTYTVIAVNMLCLPLLVLAARREGIGLRDLVGLDRARLGRDAAWGLLWLVVLYAAFSVALLLVPLVIFRPGTGPAFQAAYEQVFVGVLADLRTDLPAPVWLLAGIAVAFPLLNAPVEEMMYRGYAQPRLAVLSGRAWIGIAVMAAGFGLQHAPMAFSAAGAAVYAASFSCWGAAAGLVYRRQRRLPPLIIAHFLTNLPTGAIPLAFALAGG